MYLEKQMQKHCWGD